MDGRRVCARRVGGDHRSLAFSAPQLQMPGLPGGDLGAHVEGLIARAGREAESVLRKIKIKGDGRCLFRSIAKNVAHLTGRSLPERLEMQDADALREVAWQVICVDNAKEFKKQGIIEGDLNNYCTRMKSPDFYGGEPEMFVLSEVLKRPIGVYMEVQKGRFQKLVQYGARFGKQAKDEIKVLYNGTNHYDALI